MPTKYIIFVKLGRIVRVAPGGITCERMKFDIAIFANNILPRSSNLSWKAFFPYIRNGFNAFSLN